MATLSTVKSTNTSSTDAESAVLPVEMIDHHDDIHMSFAPSDLGSFYKPERMQSSTFEISSGPSVRMGSRETLAIESLMDNELIDVIAGSYSSNTSIHPCADTVVSPLGSRR